jgi:hypothetical protein
MNKLSRVTLTLASILALAALSGCGAYYQSVKTELATKAASDDPDIRAAYPVSPSRLAEVAEHAIDNNGYRILKAEETPDGFVIVGRLTQQVLFFKVVSPIGVLVRAKPGGTGAEAVVVSRAKDKVEDVLGWIAEDFKTNSKFAGWLKPGGAVAAAAVAAPTAGAPAAPSEILNVAVQDFAADGVSPSDAVVTANLMRNALVKTGAFNVVEKSKMDSVLAEQAFQQAGCTDQECAVKLGKILNVKRMFVGSCGKLMGEFFLSVRVVDVESGKITFADDVKAESASSLREGIKVLAEKMAASKI